MPSPAQEDAAVPADLRPVGVHLVAQLAPGEDHVQMDQGVIVPENVLLVGRRLGGEFRQDPLDLLFLLGLQLLELVVGLNHAHGLHEKGGAGGGDVVDQSRQVPLVLRLHRHHEAAVPLGDDGLLKHLGIGGGGDDALEHLTALGGRLAHVAADVCQLRGGGVGDLVLIQDGIFDAVLQIAVAMEGEEEMVDDRLFLGVLVEVLPHPPGGGEEPGDGQQLVGVQAAAPVRPGQCLRHRLDPGKGGAAPQTDHGPGRVGLILKPEDLLRLRLRHQSPAAVLGLGADGLGRQQFQHRRQLQGADGFVKQFAHGRFLLKSVFPLHRLIEKIFSLFCSSV